MRIRPVGVCVCVCVCVCVEGGGGVLEVEGGGEALYRRKELLAKQLAVRLVVEVRLAVRRRPCLDRRRFLRLLGLQGGRRTPTAPADVQMGLSLVRG